SVCVIAVMLLLVLYFFFFSSRRRHTRSKRDWSSDVCSSDLVPLLHGHIKTRKLLLCLVNADLNKIEPRLFCRLQVLLPGQIPGRSEERRVGKEWRERGWPWHVKRPCDADSVKRTTGCTSRTR